jgi:hypothetical protein
MIDFVCRLHAKFTHVHTHTLQLPPWLCTCNHDEATLILKSVYINYFRVQCCCILKTVYHFFPFIYIVQLKGGFLVYKRIKLLLLSYLATVRKRCWFVHHFHSSYAIQVHHVNIFLQHWRSFLTTRWLFCSYKLAELSFQIFFIFIFSFF